MAVDSYQATIFMGWEYIFASKCLHKLNLTENDRYYNQLLFFPEILNKSVNLFIYLLTFNI